MLVVKLGPSSVHMKLDRWILLVHHLPGCRFLRFLFWSLQVLSQSFLSLGCYTFLNAFSILLKPCVSIQSWMNVRPLQLLCRKNLKSSNLCKFPRGRQLVLVGRTKLSQDSQFIFQWMMAQLLTSTHNLPFQLFFRKIPHHWRFL